MSVWERIKYEFAKGNSAIHQIVIICLGAFIFSTLMLLAGRLGGFDPFSLMKYFYLPSDFGTLLIRPWSLVTHIFFHDGLGHAFGNLITLYFLGRILEDFMTHRRVWFMFLFGGLAGGILFVLAFNTIPSLAQVSKTAVLLGASGGLAAIIAGIGIYLPEFILRPFGLFDIKMKNASAFILFIMLSYPIIGGNFGGFFAHLGGAIFGIVYIMELQGRIKMPAFDLNKVKPKTMRKVVIDEAQIARKRAVKRSLPNQDEIDAILDKISQSGYDSLTKTEKETLFNASE